MADIHGQAPLSPKIDALFKRKMHHISHHLQMTTKRNYTAGGMNTTSHLPNQKSRNDVILLDRSRSSNKGIIHT
jgi:hypothetical protein